MPGAGGLVVTTYAPPKRTADVVRCELGIAEARIASLRKQADCLEPDSTTARAHAWYSTRAALLRRELDDPTRRP